MVEPLDPVTAKALANQALESGSLIIGTYPRKRMVERKISLAEVHRAIRGGAYQEAEWENGGWRYRIYSGVIVVVIAFRSFEPPSIALVTVFRGGR